jgi:hypothetical protein
MQNEQFNFAIERSNRHDLDWQTNPLGLWKVSCQARISGSKWGGGQFMNIAVKLLRRHRQDRLDTRLPWLLEDSLRLGLKCLKKIRNGDNYYGNEEVKNNLACHVRQGSHDSCAKVQMILSHLQSHIISHRVLWEGMQGVNSQDAPSSCFPWETFDDCSHSSLTFLSVEEFALHRKTITLLLKHQPRKSGLRKKQELRSKSRHSIDFIWLREKSERWLSWMKFLCFKPFTTLKHVSGTVKSTDHAAQIQLSILPLLVRSSPLTEKRGSKQTLLPEILLF